MNFIIEESNAVKEALRGEVRDYNRPYLGEYDLKPFSIYQKVGDALVAGVSGFLIQPHHALRLEFVWVHEAHRKQGLGRALLQAAEHYALENRCTKIQLTTMAFQAPAFYKKMGYQQIACVPQWFCGQDELFFERRLSTI